MKRRIALGVLWAAAVLLVASVVQGYAAPWANRLVNPFPDPPTTATSKEVTPP